MKKYLSLLLVIYIIIEAIAGDPSPEAEMSILDFCSEVNIPPTALQCSRKDCLAVMPLSKYQLCQVRGQMDPLAVAIDGCSTTCWPKCLASGTVKSTRPCVRDCISHCIEEGSKTAEEILKVHELYFLQRSEASNSDISLEAKENDITTEKLQSATSSEGAEQNIVSDNIKSDVIKNEPLRFAKHDASIKSKVTSKEGSDDPWWLNPPPWWMPPPPEWGSPPSTIYSSFYSPFNTPNGVYPGLHPAYHPDLYAPQPVPNANYPNYASPPGHNLYYPPPAHNMYYPPQPQQHYIPMPIYNNYQQ